MAWWGWGDPAHPRALPGAAERLLRSLGASGERRPPVAAAQVRLRDPALPAPARAALRAAVGEAHVREDREARILHAAGKSYADLVRQRAGDCEGAPDAVVEPADAGQVRAVLHACAEHGVAVIPFGGGTSVVGGVAPLRGGRAAAVSLDLRRLAGLAALDERSLTAELGPGTRGPALEALLGARGLTLGHFPQSFEHSTVGGWVATRSAGQASTGFGRIDDLVAGLTLTAPAATLTLPARPPDAAGPALRELVVGSEGALGVITSVSVRVRRRAPARRYEGFAVGSLADGADALRELAQAGRAPDVARLSDRAETAVSLALARSRAGELYLRLRGMRHGCLVIAGWEGTAGEVARRSAQGARALRARGAISLGRRPGAAWLRDRFAGPYLRDALLDRGVLAETLETVAQWSDLDAVHRAVGGALRDALAARGTPPLVLCHISHLYATGASLYFTVLARQERGREIEQWQAAKAAASEAMLSAGGAITHHHGVGRDHVPWLGRQVGEEGIALLRAAKARLDPAGIMNPGKLVG